MILTNKSYNKKPQSLQKVFLSFFFQEFKQTFILKRINKRYLALKLNSVRIGKCDLVLFVVNVFSRTISNTLFVNSQLEFLLPRVQLL